MTTRVCSISCAGRGGRLAGVRLLGERADEIWAAPDNAPEDPVGAARSSASAAAEWIADRLASAGERHNSLRLLVIDTDAVACSWVTSPSAEPAVVAAVMGLGGSSAASADAYGATRTAGPWASATLTEASVQALAESASSGRGPARNGSDADGHRLAVLSVPDVAARLVIDALDERGVPVQRAISLWHALAQAWDPAAENDRDAPPSNNGDASRLAANADRVVATAAMTTAVVLVDPAHRLVWAWSRAGRLIAGGTIRIAPGPAIDAQRVDGPSASRPIHTSVGAAVGRLAADWLGWSAQLGAAPARIVCIAPRPEAEHAPSAAHDAAPHPLPSPLEPAELGRAIGRAWPGATIDLAVVEDPIGATLDRLARRPVRGPDAAAEPRTGLVQLTNRPGRVHRAMHHWVALAILALAAVVAAGAWAVWASASDITGRVDKAAAELEEAIVDTIPESRDSGSPREYLKVQVEQLKQQRDAGSTVQPLPAILPELAAISYVLGTDMIEITDIQLTATSVSVKVTVPDLKTGDDLLQSFGAIEGTRCAWSGNFDSAGGTPLRYTLIGTWKTAKPARPDADGGGKGKP